MNRRTRILALVSGIALSACLWRPPIIPPAATGTDAGRVAGEDVQVGGFADAATPPPFSDAPNGIAEFDSCDDYAARTDGGTPPDGMIQLRDGGVAYCDPGAPTDGAVQDGDAAEPNDAGPGATGDASAAQRD